MSTLTLSEKEHFEVLLQMGSGYVLRFSNNTFADFFYEVVSVDIYDDKYADRGTSKANRLRAFWRLEDDNIVEKVLKELLEHWTAYNPSPDEGEQIRFKKCRQVIHRLTGETLSTDESEREFLGRDLGVISFADVPVNPEVRALLESRLAEALYCITEAPLATVILCGSMLEGLLLGIATSNPREFNSATETPRDSSGRPKPFRDWRLADLINVAHAKGFIGLDVKNFSHYLRDFRNFIHPNEQLRHNFAPTRHTADICLQVLKAAIASLARASS